MKKINVKNLRRYLPGFTGEWRLNFSEELSEFWFVCVNPLVGVMERRSFRRFGSIYDMECNFSEDDCKTID